MALQSILQVKTNGKGVLGRRSFLRSVGLGAGAMGVLGWRDAVALSAAELRRQGMSCILLFMRGGPSQFETFDPKPGTKYGGPTKSIKTSVSGIDIAENWAGVAKQMKDIAVIRSMHNREGQHDRAVFQMHTGYAPGGGVRYPSIGSVVAKENGEEDFDLPHFVSIGSRFGAVGSGYLGAQYSPYLVANPNNMPQNVELPGGIERRRFDRRLGLMKDLEQDFAASGGRNLVRNHQALYDGAANLVRSPRLKAFDLSEERESVRDRYGRTTFGQGCLLARRLIETGVTFVEVLANGWDTHLDNFERTKNLAGQVDPGFSALIEDLRQRGRLDKTLIIWAGEFGRTPRINGRTGRDHFPRAFNVALAGGGVKGGQVIGSTNETGTAVEKRPVSVQDLFCSFCHALNINPRKETLTPVGRPIKIVDGGETVRELF